MASIITTIPNKNTLNERWLPTDLSIYFGISILNKLPVKYHIRYFSIDDNIYTTIIILTNSNTGEYLTQGNGKGIGGQSFASALYECLEHYYLEIHTPKNVKNITVSELLSQDHQLCREAPFYELNVNDQNEKIACCCYTKYSDNKDLYYPISLLSPQFSLDLKLEAYSSNNGVATGLDIDETLIHAACELIERQSLSKLYINIIADPNHHMKRVNISTLPCYIKDIISHFEIMFKEKLEIYNISYYSYFPVYLALIRTDKLPISGSGCSIDEAYALERAVLECIQQYHLYSDTNGELEREDTNVLNLFYNYPDILRAVKLETKAIFTNYYTTSEYEQKSVPEIMELISLGLRGYGYEIYYYIINKSDHHICLKAIIPGFEKFHLIRYGCNVCANLPP